MIPDLMVPGVLAPPDDFQIFWSVVELVLVAMMNDLVPARLPPRDQPDDNMIPLRVPVGIGRRAIRPVDPEVPLRVHVAVIPGVRRP